MADLIDCRRCPRLVEWREQVAREKRAAFAAEVYWGKPVPGFGDPGARLLVVGLAPAAHGANRTGRMFTGDQSGDWLFRALNKEGFANRAASLRRDDGLALSDAFVTATVRCAPPANRPTGAELRTCAAWLEREWALLERVEVVLCLGSIAWTQVLRILEGAGAGVPRPRPRFSHAAEMDLRPEGPLVLASYHPSQQNTFTGRLSEDMLDDIFQRARGELPVS